MRRVCPRRRSGAFRRWQMVDFQKYELRAPPIYTSDTYADSPYILVGGPYESPPVLRIFGTVAIRSCREGGGADR